MHMGLFAAINLQTRSDSNGTNKAIDEETWNGRGISQGAQK